MDHLRALIALLLVLVAPGVLAYPATSTPTCQWRCVNNGVLYGTVSAAGTACLSNGWALGRWTQNEFPNPGAAAGVEPSCGGQSWGYPQSFTPGNWYRGGLVDRQNVGTGYTCPGGGTLSGQTCTCGAGQTDTGSACVSPVTCSGQQVRNEATNTCVCTTGPAQAGIFPDLEPIPAFWQYTTTRAQFDAAPAVLNGGCMGGCVVDSKKSAYVAGSTFYGNVTKTGATCTGTTPPSLTGSTNPTTPVNEDAACLSRGGMPYTLNGQRMCLDKGKIPEGVQVGNGSTSSKTTTNPDGSTTTTSTTQTPTTVCQAGACNTTITTTTTITTRDPSGTVTGVTTTTGTVNNPGGQGSGGSGPGGPCDPATQQCGEGSKFGGACSSGFTCDGDAVQCAIARDQYLRHCQTLEVRTGGATQAEAGTWYDSNSKGEGLAQSNTDLYKTGTLPTLDKTSRSLGAGSLSDLVVTVHGQTVTVPFSTLNSVLGYLGYLLMAVAFIVATKIYHRGVVS